MGQAVKYESNPADCIFILLLFFFSACLIQGEMVWISEYSGKRMPAEQNDADLFQEYQQAVEAVCGRTGMVSDSSVRHESAGGSDI